MSNQSLRQASVRAVTGTAYDYNGDWHALFDAAGIAAGDFNGRLLAWINGRLDTAYPDLPGAMQAFAEAQGCGSWNDLGTFDASNFTGILDQLSTSPSGAWSMSRALLASYVGSPLFDLRRSSDNGTLTINAGSAGAADLAGAGYTAWAGADSIFVTKVYDQTGNGKHWTQGTAGSQPRFSPTGAGTNSRAYMYQPTTTQIMSVALGWGVTGDADHSLVAYGKFITTGGASFSGLIGVGDLSSSSCLGTTTTTWWFGGAFQGGGTGGAVDTDWHGFMKRHNSSNTYGLVDGSAITSTDLAFNLDNDTLIFGKYNGANQSDTAAAAEVIAFASDIGATDAAIIAANQATFYG